MTGSEQIDGLQAKMADRKNHGKPPGTKQTSRSRRAPPAPRPRSRPRGTRPRPGCPGAYPVAVVQGRRLGRGLETAGTHQLKREEHDVTEAEEDAERAKDNASSTLDYAPWAAGQAAVVVLDAAHARVWVASERQPRRLAEHGARQGPCRDRSQVFPPAHPHEGEPADDGREAGGGKGAGRTRPPSRRFQKSWTHLR